jgi:hypothetical protein
VLVTEKEAKMLVR